MIRALSSHDAQHGEKALMACANSERPDECVHAVWSVHSLFVDIYYNIYWFCKLIRACIVRKLHKDAFCVLHITWYYYSFMYTWVVFAVSPTSWWSCWLWLCWITEWWCHVLHELCDTTTLHDTRHTWGSPQCGWGKYRGGKVCRYLKKATDLDLHCQSIQIFNIAGQQSHIGAVPHCVSFSMWIYINNLDQVIWLADNLKRPWHLNLFSMERVNMYFFFFFSFFFFFYSFGK